MSSWAKLTTREVHTSTVTLFQALLTSSMAAPFPGSHANRNSSHYPPQRPSMWPRHMQPRKPSGSEGLSQNSFPFHPLQPPSSATTKLQSSLQSTTTTMPEPSISTFASILSGKSSRTTLSHLSTALQMTWQPTSSPSPYQNGKSQRTSAISGYVAFEGEWRIFLALQLVLTACHRRFTRSTMN